MTSKSLALALVVVLPMAAAFSPVHLQTLTKCLPTAGQRHCSLNSMKMSESKEPQTAAVDRRAVMTGLFALLVTGPLAFPIDAEAA
jgi:hypothetical protein